MRKYIHAQSDTLQEFIIRCSTLVFHKYEALWVLQCVFQHRFDKQYDGHEAELLHQEVKQNVIIWLSAFDKENSPIYVTYGSTFSQSKLSHISSIKLSIFNAFFTVHSSLQWRIQEVPKGSTTSLNISYIMNISYFHLDVCKNRA